MSQPNNLNRRAFLKNGILLLAAPACGTVAIDRLLADETGDGINIAVVTDLHYADKPNRGSRSYRDTLPKMREAAQAFAKIDPAFVVELGDFIDSAPDLETEIGYAKTMQEFFSTIGDDRHHVLGNHCVETLTKDEFLGVVGQEKSYYSFDRGGIHFVVLDSCFRGDGKPYQRKNFDWTDPNVPADELDWLKADLSATDKPTIVFAHQRLDEAKHFSVKNCKEVREILESSGQVTAVLQGHNHINDYQSIAGIHYCTLISIIEHEKNGYSTMRVTPDGAISLTGFRDQKNYTWQ